MFGRTNMERNSMRKPLIVVVTLVACLIAAAAALASTQTIHDPNHDSKSDVDLKSATVDYDGTTISFTVVAYPGHNPTGGCIELKKGHFIGCFKQGSHYVGENTSGKTFNVKLTHPRKHTNEFSFKASKLGNPVPGSIYWRAAFLESDQPADAIPNKGYKKFKLTA
ncbi:MAG TPA: hypothetical protein VIL53_05045 [Solirubrobacterales bacterium]